MGEPLDSIIRRAQSRDEAAFDELVDRYAQRLFGYLYRMTASQADAEELLQEVFVRLVRMIERYDHRGRFEGWLFRIAANLARDWARRQSAGPRFVPLNGRGDQDGGTESSDRSEQWVDLSAVPPDTPMILREDVDALQRALAQLPAVEREVIMLRHFGDMSFVEIAEAMKTPLGTALARSHRAIQRLRQLMSET